LAATADRTSSVSGIFDGLKTTKAPPETVREGETYRGTRLCVVGVSRHGSIERPQQRIGLRRDLRGPVERAREAADQATEYVFAGGGPKTVFTGNFLSPVGRPIESRVDHRGEGATVPMPLRHCADPSTCRWCQAA
jgi:hypothetical protein